MRTSPHHRLFALAVSVFLGWGLVAEGRTASAGGWVPLAVRAAPGSVGTAQLPSETRQVQAPPLQVPAEVPSPGNPVVVVSTSLGDITLELFKAQAPVSVQNFLNYATDGFYTDTVFHRVRKGFMIQGGGYTASLVEKPARPPIQNEATNGLRNLRGTVAMARRATLRSATSQFYINVADNRSLDHTGYSPDEFGYAVFGRVLDGLDVADRIAAVPTRKTADMEDVPVEPVIIKSVRVVKQG
jgi:cyclophilin family peptidyl-prolyl cis-trans isomerase